MVIKIFCLNYIKINTHIGWFLIPRWHQFKKINTFLTKHILCKFNQIRYTVFMNLHFKKKNKQGLKIQKKPRNCNNFFFKRSHFVRVLSLFQIKYCTISQWNFLMVTRVHYFFLKTLLSRERNPLLFSSFSCLTCWKTICYFITARYYYC